MSKWKQLKNKSVLIAGIFLIQCATYASKLGFEMKVPYPEKDPRFTVTIVVGEDQRNLLPYYERITREALRIVEDEFKFTFRDDFSVVFDNRPEYHNGLTTVLPTNRIYVHTEVPELDSSIGLVRHSHLETTVHEMAHMMVIQQRRGFWTPFSWFVGNLSRPNLFFPRWVHEGFAVWAESQIGGRGQNGIIQADIRKYAEFYQRTKTQPLKSNMLDGSLNTIVDRNVSPGEYPYHFGYLLIDDLFKDKDAQTPGELLRRSSGRIGFLFHKLYKDQGKIMTERFEALQKEWSSVDVSRAVAPKVISKSRTMLGPFLSGSGISWIETDKDKRSNLIFENGQGRMVTPWRRSGILPTHAVWNENYKSWIVLGFVYDPDYDPKKSFFLIDQDGAFQCENRTKKRIRDFAMNGDTLAYIRSDVNGIMHFEKGTLSKDCKLSGVTELLKTTQPFERLSHPWINGNEWLVAESRGKNLTRDYIVGNNSFEYRSEDGALAFPQKIKNSHCDCLLATLYKKDYRGPITVNLKTHEVRTFPQSTESKDNYAIGENLYSRESYWEEEHLAVWNFDQGTIFEQKVEQKIAQKKPEPTPEYNFDNGISNTETSTYTAWPSIIPKL